ncbi:SDR family NAD(P)-dependent oxidoreductase [Devosia sp.]|uniref:SDR family NAD(P)-dependent oxidoreductase n=1 Tax=Devosia sp. TaxID=1871048 RepID=UPI003A91225F
MAFTGVLDRFRLDGKVALITGGTRGIGLAIAYAFAEAGAKLYLASRNDTFNDDGAILHAGHDVTFLPADLRDPSAAQKLISAVLADAGRLDILVNNAGIAASGDSESFSQDRWRELMALNVDSVFQCCQAAIGPMRKQGGGSIVNIGSMSGIASNIPQQQVGYNASKAAVHMMTKSLASDLAADNIRVNAIAPGYIDTDMSRGGINHPEWGPIWRQMTPMGRAGDPAEVATAALFLASPAGSYVTGEVLVVDGGYTTR